MSFILSIIPITRLKEKHIATLVEKAIAKKVCRKFISQFGEEIGNDDGLTFHPPTGHAYTALGKFFAHECTDHSGTHSIHCELYHSTNNNVDTSQRRQARQYDLVITRQEYQSQVAAYRRKSKCDDKKQILVHFWYSVVYPKAKELWKSQAVMDLQAADANFEYEFDADNTITLPSLPNHMIQKRDTLTLK